MELALGFFGLILMVFGLGFMIITSLSNRDRYEEKKDNSSTYSEDVRDKVEHIMKQNLTVNYIADTWDNLEVPGIHSIEELYFVDGIKKASTKLTVLIVAREHAIIQENERLIEIIKIQDLKSVNALIKENLELRSEVAELHKDWTLVMTQQEEWTTRVAQFLRQLRCERNSYTKRESQELLKTAPSISKIHQEDYYQTHS